MGAATADTDTERLTSDADGSEQASAAAEVVDEPLTNSSAADRKPTSTTTRRRRFATVAASAALLLLLLMSCGGFCVWTVMRISRIEARLERLERIGRPTVQYMAVGPPYSTDHFAPHLDVCILFGLYAPA